MESYRRRQAILSLLQATGEVQIEDLARRLGVSPNSIRNDLEALAKAGQVQRVRGGAVLAAPAAAPANGPTRPPTTARIGVHRPEKERIGQWAADLVKDGDAIILDDSSSVLQLASTLRDRRNLTVLTNGLDVALLLAQNPTNRVMLAANTVAANGSSLVGPLNPELNNGFFANTCFLSCSGLTPEAGLTDRDSDVAQIKAQMLRLARRVVALADHSKIGQVSTFRTAPLDAVDHLVTDDRLSSEGLAALQRAALCPVTVVGTHAAETFRPPTLGGRRHRIGFGNLSERMVFAQQVRRSLERAASATERFELTVRDNDLDRQKALQNAEWFVASGMDLVIEYQIDAAAGNIIMDRFNQAGIPVIAVDVPLPGATFFGADNYRAGFLAGEGLGRWVQQHWGGQLDLLIRLAALRVGNAGAARLQGLQEGVEAILGPFDPGQVVEIDSPVLVEDAASPIQELLATVSRTARVGIVGINDEAVLGALGAFERNNRLHQVVGVGQNADRLGRQALRRPGLPFIGSTRYAPETYGEQLLELAGRILNGEPTPPAVYIQHVFITKDNIEGYYPLQREVAAATPA